MSKQLIIIRHAKSAWDDPQLSDFDRPLNQRGRRDAPLMAAWLAAAINQQTAIAPDAWLVSPAKRTQQTRQYFWQQLSVSMAPDPGYQSVQHYYLGSATDWLTALSKLDKQVNSVGIIGHNPGVSVLATRLVGRTVDLPTCGVVVINLDIVDWVSVIETNPVGELLLQQYPKLLAK